MFFINLTISEPGVLFIRRSFHSIQLYHKGRWVFGELACKIIPPVSRTFLTVSILTLVAISYHRYKCIARVFNLKPSVKKTILSICLFWAATLTLYFCLDFPFRKLEKATERCIDNLSPVKYTVFVIVEKSFKNEASSTKKSSSSRTFKYKNTVVSECSDVKDTSSNSNCFVNNAVSSLDSSHSCYYWS